MRMNPIKRREQILATGLKFCEQNHYLTLTGNAIADKLGVRPSLTWHYFGDLKNFRRQILKEAIKRQNLTIIAQMMVKRDRALAKAPPELLQKAIEKIGEPYGVRN